MWVFPYLTAAATLLITAIAYADGSARSSYLVGYISVALYAFYFFPFSFALLETLWISFAAAVAMMLRGWPSSAFSLWLVITGIGLFGGLVIRHLVTEVRRQADRDVLTGLYNRRALEEHMSRDLRRAERTGEPLSVVMLDLDNLKQLNVRYGHQEGDGCLREAARAWAAELRGVDIIARFGGDEFLVAMPACMIERARKVAKRLRSATPSSLTAFGWCRRVGWHAGHAEPPRLCRWRALPGQGRRSQPNRRRQRLKTDCVC